MELDIKQNRYVPLDSRAAGTFAVFIIQILMLVVSVCTDIGYLGILEHKQSVGDFSTADIVQIVVAINLMGINIISIVFMLRWVHRAYKNLPSLGAGNLDSSPGWVVANFFIPILCLYKPYRAMKEIDRHSVATGHELDRSNLIGLWWAAWIISCILNQISFRANMKADTLSGTEAATFVSIIADSFDIIPILLFIPIMRRLRRNQQIKFDRLGRPLNSR
jgi:hypothetical protein